jgi:hypothetical protein
MRMHVCVKEFLHPHKLSLLTNSIISLTPPLCLSPPPPEADNVDLKKLVFIVFGACALLAALVVAKCAAYTAVSCDALSCHACRLLTPE